MPPSQVDNQNAYTVIEYNETIKVFIIQETTKTWNRSWISILNLVLLLFTRLLF